MNTLNREPPSYISMDWDSVGIPMTNFINNVQQPVTQIVMTKKHLHSLEKKHYIYILICILLFVILVYFCSKKSVEEEIVIEKPVKPIRKEKKKKNDLFMVQTKLELKESSEETKEKINTHIEKIEQEPVQTHVPTKVESPPKRKRIRPAMGDDFFYIDQEENDSDNNLDTQFQYKQSPFSAPPMQPAVFL